MSNIPAPLAPGDPEELDGYRVRGRLGRGGMGTVYLADFPSGQPVALKLIHPDLTGDADFRRRFAREVEAAQRVARFSTAGVIDARLEGASLYVVSEYIQGPNLAEAVRSNGPMVGGTLESVAMGVAAALAAIHGSGIVHRDLKPANVLLSPVGPKVIDFGIARALESSDSGITRSSQLMGTPSYMAPELIAGQPTTPAADVFAWGCLVAFAGTGSAPFDAATVPAVLHNISSSPPRLEGLDPHLLELVGAALDKDPGDRPAAQELLNRLVGRHEPEDAAVQQTISASWSPPPVITPPAQHPSGGQPPPDPPRAGPAAAEPRRRRGLALKIGAGAAAVLLVTGLAFLLVQGSAGPPNNTTSLYGTDFATDPGWGGTVYNEDDSPYTSGYAPGEGIMMAYDPADETNPSSGRNWSVPTVNEGDLPDQLLVSTGVQVVEGYEYLSFGVRCSQSLYPEGTDPADEDADHFVSYHAYVRADGARATIAKYAADLDEGQELTDQEVSEFRPYPAVTGEAEGEDPVSNSVEFACEFTADGGDGVPAAELNLWINGRPAADAVDEEPYPQEYADHQAVQSQAIHYDRGTSNERLRLLFEEFSVYEIHD